MFLVFCHLLHKTFFIGHYAGVVLFVSCFSSGCDCVNALFFSTKCCNCVSGNDIFMLSVCITE